MAALNKRQIEEQIGNFKAVCTKVTEVQNAIFQLLEHEEVVNQNWNNIGADFPTMVEADTSVVGEDFTGAQLQNAKNTLKDLQRFLNGDVTLTVSTNHGRNVRRLTRGITA